MFLRMCPEPSHNETGEWAAGGFDQSLDAMVVIDRESLRIIHANAAALKRTSLTYEEYTSLHIWERVPGMTPERYAQIADEVIAVSPEAQTSVERVTSHDGRQRAISTVRQALKIDGRWVIVVTTRDLADRVREQTRLEHLAAALDASDEAIYLVDRATMRYVDVNQAACALLGYTREELLQRTPNQASEELGSVDDLADGLAKLIDEPELRTALGSAAREAAVRTYTWRAHTARILEKLEERRRATAAGPCAL